MTRICKLIVGFFVVLPSVAYSYTPLITSADFDGPKADVNTVALGVIGMVIVVAALGMVLRGIFGGR